MAKTKYSRSPDSGTASSRSENQEKLISRIRASYSGIFLVSAEEQRVEAQLKEIATELKFGKGSDLNGT